MSWAVESLPELRGFVVEWAEPGNYYLSRRNRLFHSTDLKPPFSPVCSVKAPAWKQAACTSRLAQRLLRFMVTNVVVLPNGSIFVTFDKSVGRIANGEYRELKGLVRPCRVLRSGCAVDGSGNVFFGEYLSNPERGEIGVYRYSSSDDTLEIVYKFAKNSIRHIHGIYADPYTGSLYCLTGDSESECKMLSTNDGFKTLKAIGEGDETWRAVSLLFTEDAIYYGTDAEFRSNQIFRLDRKSGRRDELGEVDGTVFYSKKLSNGLFFATTAENAPSQKENVAALWSVGDNAGCIEIARFQKDRWNGTLFQFGTIQFPYYGGLRDELYFHLVGVNEDNQSFRICRTVD